MAFVHRAAFRVSLILILVAVFTGCVRHRETAVERGNRDGILLLGNGAEPHGLDPELETGIPEANILRNLFENLVVDDPTDPRQQLPGVAERWEIAPDGLEYTFHLRANATWSNGRPVTANDFVASYRRFLTPELAAQYAYLLYPIRNAEAFHKATLKDPAQVGISAPDARTLRLTLGHPAPYFLGLLGQLAWFAPVPIDVIASHGPVNSPTNPWTRAGNLVGNGPFVLAEWKTNQEIVLRKNPKWWNAASVKLNEVHFLPIEDLEAEEQAFRAGLIHRTYSMPIAKIAVYRREHPELLRLDPLLGIYFYMLNTKQPPLTDRRIRQALAMSIDRKSIVENVARGGQEPAFSFTPPKLGTYTSQAQLRYDPEAARHLLAEAGYPGGKGLPPVSLLFNTSENHRSIAEAVQQMWRKELGIDVQLANEEWKVYLDARRTMSYQIARAGWLSYPDPTGWLENFITDGGNNQTGFASAEYERLLADGNRAVDPALRNHAFQQAEAILMDEVPIIPIYYYTNPYLLSPSVHGWALNNLEYHPCQFVWLQ